MACLGPFCGYFRDELEADSDEEREDDDDSEKASSKMTGKKKKRKLRFRRRKPQAQDDGVGRGASSAKMRWAQYLHQVNVKVKARGGVEMVQQVSELRADSAQSLTHGMLKCISQLPKLHAIEIINCSVQEVPPLLSDCESLVILRMSHNRLRTFSEDFARCSLLEQIVIDWNDISEIGPGIFNSRGFNHLEVINIAHNALSHLPPDFGITAKPTMRQIDLSNNEIASIPDSILSCRNLEELNLSHNRLKQLPREFSKLFRLQRLYVSFNDLTCLPEDIGRCTHLTKIRIISNQIKELPDSIIDLWPKKPGGRGGKLEQFLVERNPLVMPSITAFEMDNGGIDRAFRLLYEHIQEKEQKRQLQIEAQALRDRQQESIVPIEDARPHTISGDSSALEAIIEGATPRSTDSGAGNQDYYFSHCRDDPAKIVEIRDAESTLLLIKKNMFLSSQKQLAEEVLDSGDPLPENLKLFLDPDCQDKFKGIVPVRDLDLYFNLLVFSMKQQFPTCQQLFIKYEDGDKGYITREEWNEFCLCVPIQINDHIRDQMWQLMAFRRSEHDRVSLNDFVAAWQIHDIEAQDPFVASMTKVLQLDYYDMSVRELRERVRAQGARDATPQLDFDNDKERTDLKTHSAALQDSDGIRTLDQRLLAAAERQEKTAAKRTEKALVPTAGGGGGKKQVHVSLTDSQYQSQSHARREQTDDGDDDVHEDEDDKLSAGSDSEEEDFDAPLALRAQELRLQNLERANPRGRIAIDSDEAIRKLMELPMEAFFGHPLQRGDAQEDSAADKKAANPEQEDEKKEASKRQDSFMVRRALLQVHRSMPHSDFVSLINYLLRALQMVKHQGGRTYWHADDPSFKHVLGEKGTNEYTRKLLLQLGFVRLSEVHWVWPNPIFDTPHRVISKEVDKGRLDQMIVLLKSCQMSLYKSGHHFTGNFALLR